MTLIKDILVWLMSNVLSAVYGGTGNLIISLFVGAFMLSTAKAVISFIKLKNKEVKVRHSISVEQIKNMAISEDEKARRINALPVSNINILVPLLCGIVRYYIAISIFFVARHPIESINGLTEGMSCGFLYMDNIFEKKLDIILPLASSILTVIGTNFLSPPGTISKKNILITMTINTLTITLLGMAATRTYLVVYVMSSAITCLFNMGMAPYKKKTYEKVRKIQQEAKKSVQT